MNKLNDINDLIEKDFAIQILNLYEERDIFLEADEIYEKRKSEFLATNNRPVTKLELQELTTEAVCRYHEGGKRRN
jgi:hypothetical protein